jgi:hypothetical protein
VSDCDLCREIAGVELPGGLLWDTDLAVAFHVPPLLEPTPMLGRLLVGPRRHVHTWAGPTDEAAAEVGGPRQRWDERSAVR